MNKNKKWGYAAILCIVAGQLAACTPADGDAASEKEQTPAEQTSDQKSSSTEPTITEEKEADQFVIAFNSAKELKDEDEQLLQLRFTIRNTSADAAFFDSLFLTATNQAGDSLNMAPKDNFAANLEPGEEKTGTVYFLMEGDAPFILSYSNPETDSTAEWEIEEVE